MDFLDLDLDLGFGLFGLSWPGMDLDFRFVTKDCLLGLWDFWTLFRSPETDFLDLSPSSETSSASSETSEVQFGL